MCKLAVVFASLLFVAPTPMQNHIQFIGGASDPCDTDPLGQSWGHLKHVTNWEGGGTTLPYTADYTVSGGDTTWAVKQGSPTISSSANKNGTYGIDSNSTLHYVTLDGAVLGTNSGFNNGFRAGVWAKIIGSGNAGGEFAFNFLGGGNDYVRSRLELAGNATSGWDIKMFFWHNGSESSCTTTNIINEDTWYFMEYVFDGNANEAYFKVNGSKKCTMTGKTGTADDATEFRHNFNVKIHHDDFWLSWDEDFDIYDHVVTNGCTSVPAGL